MAFGQKGRYGTEPLLPLVPHVPGPCPGHCRHVEAELSLTDVFGSRCRLVASIRAPQEHPLNGHQPIGSSTDGVCYLYLKQLSLYDAGQDAAPGERHFMQGISSAGIATWAACECSLVNRRSRRPLHAAKITPCSSQEEQSSTAYHGCAGLHPTPQQSPHRPAWVSRPAYPAGAGRFRRAFSRRIGLLKAELHRFPAHRLRDDIACFPSRVAQLSSRRTYRRSI